MIGLVIVAHANIAREMLRALEHVVGPQSLIEAVDVRSDEDVDEARANLRHVIARCDGGHGVLVATDMFGGTPCNLALSCLDKGKVEVVSGFNLPMLVKASKLRAETNDVLDLARQVQETGRYHMHLASDLLDDQRRHA